MGLDSETEPLWASKQGLSQSGAAVGLDVGPLS